MNSSGNPRRDFVDGVAGVLMFLAALFAVAVILFGISGIVYVSLYIWGVV